ncbi:MAG TPA: hypothetical protein VJ323_14415 [Bryobacteraceae bacterium]|jgi:hypothetical protein|nr:hypothetical protein [Bryobacteraceae bacterium]
MKREDLRLLAGTGLLTLARIGLLVALADVISSLVFVWRPTGPGLWYVLGPSILMLVAACVVFRDLSLLWQVTLQTLAVAGVLVGASVILNTLFRDWRGLLSVASMLAVVSIAFGVGCAVLMRRLQAVREQPDA